MRDECKPWHNATLNHHKTALYVSLIHEHNITNETAKEVVVEEEEVEGFFAVKNRKKYFIPSEHFKLLPIKAGEKLTRFKQPNDDIVYYVEEPIPFRIMPTHTIETRQLIDNFLPFGHSKPELWTLLKIIGVACYVCRTYVCISSMSTFGKSSVFTSLHAITDKCPVFRPRSIPGVLYQITDIGNMVFDDVLDAKKDIRTVMEEINLKLADGSVEYINGALKTHNTKETYPCKNQSITYLYNTLDHYKNPDEYFDKMFANNGAIDKRFLKFRFDGILTEKFKKNFNVVQCAEDNKMKYIEYAKELAYLQKAKVENSYQRRYIDKFKPKIVGRLRETLNEILWMLDRYCNSQEEFDKYFELLLQGMSDYRKMVDKPVYQLKIEEEVVEDE